MKQLNVGLALDLKKSGACLLLTQRGAAHLQLKEPKAALRDAVAAMDLEHSAAEAWTSASDEPQNQTQSADNYWYS